MTVAPIDTGLEVGDNPRIVRIDHDWDRLLIEYDPGIPGKRIEITFEHPRGFRCLDESDLNDWWQDSSLAAVRFGEVLDGGWMAQEALRSGFLAAALGFREFAILGSDDCLSVLSATPPRFRGYDIDVEGTDSD